MLSKNDLKFFRTLKDRAARQQSGLFIAEGSKMLAELLQTGIAIKHVVCTTQFKVEANTAGAPAAHVVTAREFEQLSCQKTPNGILAIAHLPKSPFNNLNQCSALVPVLCNVQDPGNVGTILRTADWFGLQHIVVTPQTADVWSPKVVQSSMGSAFRVQVLELTIPQIEAQAIAANLPLLAADLGGSNLYTSPIARRGLLLLGNESKGIPTQLAPSVKTRFTIPGVGGTAESLNVAVSFALVAGEYFRQGLR